MTARVAIVVTPLAGALWLSPPVSALPATQADDTWMVDARVRALADAGGWTWIGGSSTSS